MNANELADKLQLDKARALSYADTVVQAATMLRQQQAEMEELEKENNDLRYLIATKLEQQDEIEKWKRMYKDMHNLATKAMSRNHQLEKEAQEK